MQVKISRDEIMAEPPPWPSATYENMIAVLMARKGLRLRPSFDPKPDDLLPPWRVDEDLATKTYTIWQGEVTTPRPPATEQ